MKDVHWYVRALEEVGIRAVDIYKEGIEGEWEVGR